MKKTFKCRVLKTEIGKKFIPVTFTAKSPEEGVTNVKMCFADGGILGAMIKDDEKFTWYSVSLECVENEDETYNIDVPMNGKFTTLKNILPSEVIK